MIRTLAEAIVETAVERVVQERIVLDARRSLNTNRSRVATADGNVVARRNETAGTIRLVLVAVLLLLDALEGTLALLVRVALAASDPVVRATGAEAVLGLVVLGVHAWSE